MLFEPLAAASAVLRGLTHWPNRDQLKRLLKTSSDSIVSGSGRALRLVPPDLGPGSERAGYEARLFLTGELETRDASWHDLLNVLAWITFPRAKAALNARHYAELDSPRTANARTPSSDALTLFDESGVIVASSDRSLLQLIRDFAWKDLFWEKRDQVSARMRFVILGHGLYEQALHPFIGLTGKALLVTVDETFFAGSLADQLVHLDERAAAALSNGERFLGTRELTPLPILGIPGWCEANTAETFYDDLSYFRTGRRDRMSRVPII